MVCQQNIGELFDRYSTQPFIALDIPVKKAKNTTYVLNTDRTIKIVWEIVPCYTHNTLDFIFIIGKKAIPTDKQLENLQIELENVIM